MTLVVGIREDRTGPGGRGYNKTAECGCIMTLVCKHLGLPQWAQYGTEPTSFNALRMALESHGAPTNLNTFQTLVETVQRNQDHAWQLLIGDGDADLARTEMTLAIEAAAKLGIKVKWLPGRDWAGPIKRFLKRKS